MTRKGPEMDRLPPPAFPPGTRRGWVPGPAGASPPTEGGGIPSGALISPDERIRRIGEGFPEGAFISPNDPISEGGEGASGTEGGEVTGIGSSDPDTYRGASSMYAGPREPEEVAAVLEELAESLRNQGAAALVTPSHLSPFESALRGFIGGYLVSRRGGHG